MQIFTDKNLVDIIPIRDKSWEECGIDMNTVEVLVTKDSTNGFFKVVDKEKFESVKLASVEEITEEERERRIAAVKQVQEKERAEYEKTTDAYRIKALEERVALAEAMINANVEEGVN